MKKNEPSPPDPLFPRYTRMVFPAYRYVPGRSAHPRKDPLGHSFDKPEPSSKALDPADWARAPLYLRAVDLYNYAYWWEAHEAFEGLWQGAEKTSPLGQMFRGLIQIAASNLKRYMGAESAAQTLGARGLSHLREIQSPWLGVDIRLFEEDALDYLENIRSKPALLKLAL